MNLTFGQTAQGTEVSLLLRLANRHGLIAGATGTGKTVTLQTLAEKMSQAGIPVFLADIKGDLAGLAAKGEASPKITERFQNLKKPLPDWQASPVMFWDVFGEQGHPLRTTMTEMGAPLLGRLLNLNETQSSVLQILFKIADDSGLLLLDLKDLDALIRFAQENLDKLKPQYGHLSPASIGAIQRSLLTLAENGAEKFFGEPALDIHDFMQNDKSGKGYVNILAANKLMQSPVVYSTFLIWMLSELFEQLPEVGDLDKPKLVFFFDEAHLLFKDAPKALLEKIEQVVRLIRSKGVGVYFISQNPLDIPESVLGQLSNRVQHALRAFTPADQKAVKVAAQTMRPNPKFSTEEAITQLAIGEALVSLLDETGSPTVSERVLIWPPCSKVGPLSNEDRTLVIKNSPLAGFYEKTVDRKSAFEIINESKKSAQPQTNVIDDESAEQNAKTSSSETGSALNEILFGSTGPRGGRKAGLVEKAATSAARTVASSIGREIVRGLLGSLTGSSGGRRRR